MTDMELLFFVSFSFSLTLLGIDINIDKLFRRGFWSNIVREAFQEPWCPSIFNSLEFFFAYSPRLTLSRSLLQKKWFLCEWLLYEKSVETVLPHLCEIFYVARFEKMMKKWWKNDMHHCKFNPASSRKTFKRRVPCLPADGSSPVSLPMLPWPWSAKFPRL